MVPLSLGERIEAMLFLALGLGLCVAGAVFLLGIARDEPLDRYWITFEESVSGIDENTQVLFRGVPCGKVTDVELTAAQVHPRVWIEVQPNLPLTTATRARISLASILGRLHIELENAEESAPALTADTIPSVTSKMARFVNTGESLGDKMIDAMDQAIQLISPARQEELFATVKAIGDLARTSEASVNTLTPELIELARSLRATSDELRGQLEAYEAPVQSLLQDSAATVASARRLLESGDVQRLVADTNEVVIKLGRATERALQSAERWLADNQLTRLEPLFTRTADAAIAALEDLRRLSGRLEREGLELVRADLRPAITRLAELGQSLGRLVALLERQPRALLFGSEAREAALPRAPENPPR